MSYFRDAEFQERLLAFVCRDKNFLKKTSGLLSPVDFKPRKNEGIPEAYIIAELAFKYWHDYREPIGGMLRTDVLDYIREHKRKLGGKSRERLTELVEKIRHTDNLVAVEAIERKVAEYKQRENKRKAIHDLIDAQEKGELSDSKFRRICKNALEVFDNNLKVSNYSNDEEIKRRIRRREKNVNRKFPYLFIDPLDKEVRTFPRGEMGIVVAKYKTGKSTLAVHFDHAYALQGFKVLHFTLEDNLEMVEDRLDSSFAGIKMKYLFDKSSKLKRRLRRALVKLRADIKVVDGTDGGMSMQRIEEVWENYRNQGFTADVVIVDSDEGILPPEHFKGDNAETRESKIIYQEAKHFAARRDLWLWMFAQTKRGTGQRKMIVRGDDSATDISKMRRCAMGIGVGDGPEEWGDDSRYINIAIHRYDKMNRGWPIMGDFERAIFYDRELTEEAVKQHKKHHD
jgi:replicative DNA helicase